MRRVVEITDHSKDFKEFQANMFSFFKLTRVLYTKKAKNELYYFWKNEQTNNQSGLVTHGLTHELSNRTSKLIIS